MESNEIFDIIQDLKRDIDFFETQVKRGVHVGEYTMGIYRGRVIQLEADIKIFERIMYSLPPLAPDQSNHLPKCGYATCRICYPSL